MKFLFCTIFLALATSTYSAPRVIGGSNAPDGKYPYQVSLRKTYDNSHFCGGSILNKRWILTAAHCLESQSRVDVKVVVGTNKIHGNEEQSYQVEFMTHHQNFSYSKRTDDIGLIRVDHDIVFNDKVQPISLPKEDFTKVNQPAVLTGWGKTKYGGPNDLQEITLKVIGQGKCKELWNGKTKITKSHICTLTKSGEGACNGDSGGPLVVDGIQVGIVSFGMPCALGKPDVYTRVYTFLSWINEQFSKF